MEYDGDGEDLFNFIPVTQIVYSSMMGWLLNNEMEKNMEVTVA
jgi:hypothetical protein